jgi:hypothetical protein
LAGLIWGVVAGFVWGLVSMRFVVRKEFESGFGLG